MTESARRLGPILRVITRLNVGGPTRHVALLQEGLALRGWHGEVASGRCAEGEGEGVLSVPGEHHVLEELGRAVAIRRDARTLRALRSLIRRLGARVVHTHQGKAGYLGRMAASREGVEAIVHTYHGHTFQGYFGPVKARAYLAAERRAARCSHAIVCQSESQRSDVALRLGRAGEGKLWVIPPAVDPRAVSGQESEGVEIRERLGVPSDRLVLLLPARLVEIKAPERALRLLRELRPHWDCELWIVGEGPLESELRSEARRFGLAERVRFLPPLAYPAPYYHAADLCLLTSRAEGTPLALLEAAWLGTPVIATRVGGIEDLFGELLVGLDSEASEAEWAGVLRERLESEAKRSRLGGELRKKVRAEYSPEALVARVDGLYRRLLGDPEAPDQSSSLS